MVQQSGEVNQYYGGGDGCAKDKINHICQIYVDFCLNPLPKQGGVGVGLLGWVYSSPSRSFSQTVCSVRKCISWNSGCCLRNASKVSKQSASWVFTNGM